MPTSAMPTSAIWRNVRRTWRLFGAMSRMIRELTRDPAAGYLGGESWLGNPTVMVQYWRSFEDLERYARAEDREHRPAWAAFNRMLHDAAKSGSGTRPIGSGLATSRRCTTTCPRLGSAV